MLQQSGDTLDRVEQDRLVRKQETLDCLGISESTYFRLIRAGVVPGPEGRGCVMITPIKIQGLDLGEFFRTLTFGSPEWVRRMEREVRAGNKQTIKLLEAYLLGLPQSLREAVLAVRVIAAPQVRKDAEVVFQTRTP